MFSFLFKKSRETGVCERALCFLGVSIEGAGTKQPILHQNGQCLKKPIIHIFLVCLLHGARKIIVVCIGIDFRLMYHIKINNKYYVMIIKIPLNRDGRGFGIIYTRYYYQFWIRGPALDFSARFLSNT